MRVPSTWGLESPRVFTQLSCAGSNLKAGLPGTVVQSPAAAWTPAQGSQSTCCSQVGRRRIALYDGCSLRSHVASLCSLLIKAVTSPPRLRGRGHRPPTSQWEECQRACTRASKLPQQEVTAKLLSAAPRALTVPGALPGACHGRTRTSLPTAPGDGVSRAWCFRIRDGGGTQGDGQGCPEFGIERVTLGSRGPVFFFFFPPSSSKLRIFLEFLKNLT